MARPEAQAEQIDNQTEYLPLGAEDSVVCVELGNAGRA
jgi:hypothetical protein